MNQILVTEKLYVTPELKRKKKIYKVYFIISLFVVCVLTSLYIYAEYDRNKSAEASTGILASAQETINEADETTADGDVLLVVLNGDESDEELKRQTKWNTQMLHQLLKCKCRVANIFSRI